MAIIVEDGSGSDPQANSYIDAQYVTAYADARGLSASADIDAALIGAMDYLLRFDWQGRRTSQEQPLAWPRQGVSLHGTAFPGNEIPELLKDAQARLAINSNRIELAPVSDNSKYVTAEREGDLQREYADPTDNRDVGAPYMPVVASLLDPLLANDNVMWLAKV